MWKYFAKDSFSAADDVQVTLSVDKYVSSYPNLIEPLTYNKRPLKLTIK